MKKKKVKRAKVDTLMLVLKTDLRKKKNSRLVLGQHKQMGGANAFCLFAKKKKEGHLPILTYLT